MPKDIDTDELIEKTLDTLGYTRDSLSEPCKQMLAAMMTLAAQEMMELEAAGLNCLIDRPSALMRPALMIDGNKWCALYGSNLHDGVAGFGDSVAEAMLDFDRKWVEKLNTSVT